MSLLGRMKSWMSECLNVCVRWVCVCVVCVGWVCVQCLTLHNTKTHTDVYYEVFCVYYSVPLIWVIIFLIL